MSHLVEGTAKRFRNRTKGLLMQPAQPVSHAARTFKRENFRQLTIGLQIRRKKCMLACRHPPCPYGATPEDIGCRDLPQIADYASMAKALQIARNVEDKDTAFLVATDEAQVYDEVGILGLSKLADSEKKRAQTVMIQA